MSSENSKVWYGNLDAERQFPLTNKRDMVNYVMVKTPIVRVSVARETQIMRANNLSKVQVFTPEDYDKLKNPMRVAGGKNREPKVSIFEKNKKAEWRVIHDPTRVVAEAEAPKEDAAFVQKRKRRTREEMLADMEAEAMAAGAVAPTGEEVSDEL